MKPVAETREARYNYDRIFVKQRPPQGMTEEEFEQVSDSTNLFCRINVQTQMPFLEFVSFIARCAGGSVHMSAIRAKSVDVSVFENDDFDAEKSRTGDDRWLYFRYTLEADPVDGVPPKDYVSAVGALLNSLWSSRMDAVAACDIEEQLPRNARRLVGFGDFF
jgi:hypothetical protein